MTTNMENTWTPEKTKQLRFRLELLQYQYFNGRPLWTSIKLEDLKLFMAYTYFGYPFDENLDIDESVDDLFSYYSNEIKNNVLNMCHIIETKFIRQHSNIEVGVTITQSICSMKCNTCNNFPDQDIHNWYLIRIKLDNLKVIFIDLHHSRTYKSWDDYIVNNSLPQGLFCYPPSGYYVESDYLSIDLTPSSRTSRKILSGLDAIGTAANFSSSLLLASGLIFPVMTPVLIPASVTIGSVSAYEAGRNISKLKDLNEHNQSLTSKEACKHWLDLGISTLGIITAPMTSTLKTLQLSNSAVMTTEVGKTLNILQKSAYVTYCSLEAIRFCMTQKEKELTAEYFMRIRLDLFIVLGSVLPMTFIQEILEFTMSAVPLSEACALVATIPYCVGRQLFKTVSYMTRHAAEFARHAANSVRREVTPEKMLSAWLEFRRLLDAYGRSLDGADAADVIAHVARDLVALPPPPRSGRPGADAWDAELRDALGGPRMRELLDKLAVDPADARAVRFCAERAAAEAAAAAAVRDDAAAECARRGFADAAAVDRQFRREYPVAGWSEREEEAYGRDDGRVAAAWYARRGMQTVGDDAAGFWTAYRRDRGPAAPDGDGRLAFERRVSPTSTLRAYQTDASTVAAGAADLRNAASCARLARSFDRAAAADSRAYRGHRLYASDLAPGACVLWSASAFSLRLVCFSVQSPEPGAPPSLNVCVYTCSK